MGLLLFKIKCVLKFLNVELNNVINIGILMFVFEWFDFVVVFWCMFGYLFFRFLMFEFLVLVFLVLVLVNNVWWFVMFMVVNKFYIKELF